VTVSTTEVEEELLALQVHHHSKSCKKRFGDRSVCRFSFPWPPMKNTSIVRSLPEDCSDSERIGCETLMKSIRTTLNDLDSLKDKACLKDMTFETLLIKIGCSDVMFGFWSRLTAHPLTNMPICLGIAQVCWIWIMTDECPLLRLSLSA
jgi:hypothetical protein